MENVQSNPTNRQHLTPAVLPTDAQWMSVGGIDGWYFSLFDPYGDPFSFFAWHDGVAHQISLVDPPLEDHAEAVGLRIGADGRLQPFGTSGSESFLTAFTSALAWLAHRAVFDRVGSTSRTATSSRTA